MITSNRLQILNLLLSTYETAMAKNLELMEMQDELKTLNKELEERVRKRTEALQIEVAERKAAEAALQAKNEELNTVTAAALAGGETGDDGGAGVQHRPRTEQSAGHRQPPDRIPDGADIRRRSAPAGTGNHRAGGRTDGKSRDQSPAVQPPESAADIYGGCM